MAHKEKNYKGQEFANHFFMFVRYMYIGIVSKTSRAGVPGSNAASPTRILMHCRIIVQ